MRVSHLDGLTVTKSTGMVLNSAIIETVLLNGVGIDTYYGFWPTVYPDSISTGNLIIPTGWSRVATVDVPGIPLGSDPDLDVHVIITTLSSPNLGLVWRTSTATQRTYNPLGTNEARGNALEQLITCRQFAVIVPEAVSTVRNFSLYFKVLNRTL